MPVNNRSLTQLRNALPLAKALTTAVDVDRNKKVTVDRGDDARWSELARLDVRDNFVTRNLLREAASREVGRLDKEPTPKGMAKQLDGALASLERADANKDGVLSDAELAKASKLGRLLATFGEAHQGKTVADFKIRPLEKPGTRAWTKLAESRYYGPSSKGAPRFGSATITPREKLPKAVRAQYDALAKRTPGAKVEAQALLINGATAWFVHAKTADRVSMLVVTSAGKAVAEGTATAPKLTAGQSAHTVHWKTRWIEK